MKLSKYILITMIISIFIWSCKDSPKLKEQEQTERQLSAKDILGNPKYLAMSYGGYRNVDHDIEPTIEELKEDMKLLSAMGVGIIRTYKVYLPHASNVLKAISELKKEDPDFEMYVMLGAWISCKNAFSDQEPIHNEESEANATEIDKAVSLANQYPDIVKVIAVGNEAMVKWQAQYYVEPGIILKWVNHLQNFKTQGKLPKDLWITSSDNFASWGGGEDQYHVEDLNSLIRAVDFISMHTYPMHDTHYNPAFWYAPEHENELSSIEKIDAAMNRSLDYSKAQYKGVFNYMKSIGADKPIHIGETGWATLSNSFYGPKGSKATDEYKEAKFYDLIRDYTNENRIACFYFEGFDEPWKDANNPEGSENHFGLFTVDGKAKFALWDMVDKGVFKGLTRNGKPIKKTYSGDKEALMKDVLVPPTEEEMLVHK
ncbi:glycosyl hydrolase family 17 [Winogradskyella flava]|uniref:Endo-1,3-beta-glucanase btgC n=1 Tax=Winogradskyella flava TaxID=1884876 RepID=A0A842IX93_9FLAO|nr:glycosyl hydrolase family 17 [Winogradskyella flava]MBC2846316.1 glycosyl hydrolase family 17 [Winogradskyella flava]